MCFARAFNRGPPDPASRSNVGKPSPASPPYPRESTADAIAGTSSGSQGNLA